MIQEQTQQATRKRLEDLDFELRTMREQRDALKAHWSIEKERIQTIQSLKASIEHARQQANDYARRGGLGKVAEIRYGTIVQLEKDLAQAQSKLQEIQAQGTMLKQEVSAEDIAEIIAKWTGIPVQRMMETERTKLLYIEERLHERVIGQEEAIHAVSNAIRRSRVGLQDSKRPIGSFIFLGTTGVGKTELARALAEFMFDDEQALIRIDMSEYMEKHTVARLIGAPPGYVGYEEGGQLTEAVRRKPYSIVLFDELEKAHHDVFNILLQVLDDGRLTDSQGREVNFKNTIIIMTSNLGTELIQEHVEAMNGPNREHVVDMVRSQIFSLLKQRVRPEFLNRIDEILLFPPLERKEVRKIAEIQIKLFEKTLAENNLSLNITETALDWLAVHGFDIQYGARPLKRLIQRSIIDPLALKLLSGEISGGDTIYIDMAMNGTLQIAKEAQSLFRIFSLLV